MQDILSKIPWSLLGLAIGAICSAAVGLYRVRQCERGMEKHGLRFDALCKEHSDRGEKLAVIVETIKHSRETMDEFRISQSRLESKIDQVILMIGDKRK